MTYFFSELPIVLLHDEWCTCVSLLTSFCQIWTHSGAELITTKIEIEIENLETICPVTDRVTYKDYLVI